MRITSYGHRLASMGARIIVEVTEGPRPELRLRAPFYKRAIAVSDIASLTYNHDDGMNHGLVNWFVTGRASSPHGVRLNTGGKARLVIETHDGRLYNVVVDDMDQAERLTCAVQEAQGH